MSIQWFPGHMAKAKQLLAECIPLVDVVIELRDARIPLSSNNPLLAQMLGGKPRVIALTKPDLADERRTSAFAARFEREGVVCVAVNARDNRGTRELLKIAKQTAERIIPRDRANGRALRTPRLMVAGIPNVGKSSLINALCQRKAARTGALPGLTRAKQWIRLASGLEILDTPGLLWPRLDDPDIAFRLAVTGAIGEGGFDRFELAEHLVQFLVREYPAVLSERYGIDVASETDATCILTAIGERRGCLALGGQVDLARVADLVLAEFRLGKMGRFTLDKE
ncbi:MAG: Ribosome biogenesis GTPase A [Firmicutes bacterium]|nr:Ribosome biogenesis GTPase A [candidate division NPL-UPA2 bacterium]